MLSLMESNAADYFKSVDDIKELDEFVVHLKFTDVVYPTSKKHGIQAIFFEGGTLAIDNYSWSNDLGGVKLFIKELESNNLPVVRVKVAKGEDIKVFINNVVESTGEFDKEISEAETIQQFEVMMAEAIKCNAEDIYITVSKTQDVAFAQFKVEGRLLKRTSNLKDFTFGKAFINAIYNSKGIGTTRGGLDDVSTPQEKQVQHKVYKDGELVKHLQIRFTKLKTSRPGELVVNMRIQKELRRFKDFDMDDRLRRLLLQKVKKNKGIIITSGTTGSGKSSLVFALLLEVEKDRIIVTFEDPIEIEKPADAINIIQNSIDKEVGYHNQLKANMRIAPNLVFVQEVRDEATADFVFYTGRTGHPVLTTLHSNSVLGIPERLIDMGVSHQDLGSEDALSVLMNQALVRKLCKHCKIPASNSDAVDEFYKEDAIKHGCKDLNSHFVRNDNGCVHCLHKGEITRQLFVEYIDIGREDRAYLSAGDINGWKQFQRDKGFVNIAEQIVKHVDSGEISLASLMENVV